MDEDILLRKVHRNTVRMARDRGYHISDHNKELDQLDAEQVALLGREGLNKVFCRWSSLPDPEDVERMEALVRDLVGNTSRAQEDQIISLEQHLESEGHRLLEVLYVHHLHNPNGGQARVNAARDLLLKVLLLVDTFGDERASTVLITANTLTPAASAALQPVMDQCTLFNEGELTVLAVDHRYTPPHSLLTPEETAAYLAANGITAEKNALVKASDPVVRYYGWRPGQVLRIIRDYSSLDMPSGRCVAYRTVVSNY